MISDSSPTKIDRIFMFLLSFSIFEGYLFNQFLLIGIIGILLTCYVIWRQSRVYFSNYLLLWYLPLFFLLLGATYSPAPISALKYCLMYVAVWIIAMDLRNMPFSADVLFQNMIYCSGVHVIATLVRQINVRLVDSICKILFYPALRDSYTRFVTTTVGNVGITNQTGWNAFYISAFIGLIFCQLMNQKKGKFISFIWLVAGYFALFFTTKRSFLLLAFCIPVLLLLSKLKKFSFKQVVGCLVALSVLIGIFAYAFVRIPALQYTAARFMILTRSLDEFSSGRTVLYREALSLIFANPIRILFGYGTFSSDSLLGMGVHNVFLQIWLENGIIALCTYLFIFGIFLRHTLFAYKNTVHMGDSGKVLQIALYFELLFLFYCFFGNPLYEMQMILLYLASIAVADGYAQNALRNKLGERT